MTKFVDMALTEAEQKDMYSLSPATVEEKTKEPVYPYGLSICLNHTILDKLGMDDNLESGDIVELEVICKVRSKTSTDRNGKQECNIELQITDMAVEGEGAEPDDDEDDKGEGTPPRRLGRRLPYKE